MINYPNRKKANSEADSASEEMKSRRRKLTAANRGMDFEHAINSSNAYYDDAGRAIITKRPTPIRVVKVDYSKNARIVDAYFEKQSTTDYNGVYRGRYVDFECKETQSETALAFHNISSHQIAHLKKVIRHGGIAFFLIYFAKRNEIYLLDAQVVIEAYEHQEERKSLSYASIAKQGYLIEQGFIPRIRYLDAVDRVYFHEKKQL